MRLVCTKFGIINKRLVVLACTTLVSSNYAVTALAVPCSELKVPPPPASKFDVAGGLAYMKTREYKKEFSQAIKDARKACEKHIGEDKVAIVSDIDETCLDNKQYFIDNPKAGWGDWLAWVHESKAPTLKSAADFLAWARKKGFAIFFITGRHERERAATISNLVKVGLAYDGLYMRPNDDDSPAELMKSKYRKQISDMGFNIVVNIGDQYSDLTGGLAEDCEKLPNKIYYIK